MIIKKKKSSKVSFTAEELTKFKAMFDAVKSMEEDDDEEDDEDLEEEDGSEDTPAVIIMSSKKKGKMIKKSD
jgi:hypothetical protein